MLKCICCKYHVHIVLGDQEGDIRERRPTQFGWPLFSQDAVEFAEKYLLEHMAESEEDRDEMREFFSRLYPRINKQGRGKNGRFTGPYLPKSGQGSPILYGSVIKAWLDFVNGKARKCEYIQQMMLGDFMVPVYDCSLIRYITPPPSTLQRFKELVWEGVFEVQTNIEVV
jgi:hypothetical protein